jgi:hypothetical protein
VVMGTFCGQQGAWSERRATRKNSPSKITKLTKQQALLNQANTII